MADKAERNLGGQTRLDTWKEIAAYFGRDVRTVRRWEAVRGLPVHRVPGTSRGGVFAYVAELHEWLHAGASWQDRDGAAEEGETGPGIAPAVPEEDFPDEGPLAETAGGRWAGWEDAEPPPTGAGERWAAPWGQWMVLGLIVAATAVVALAVVRSGRLPHRAGLATARAPGREASALGSDPVTRDLYLRGRYLAEQRTGPSLREAVSVFSQAITRDGQLAPAYAGLAESYLLLRQYGGMRDAEAYPRAYAASRRAVELDGDCAEAHRAYGFALYFWMWNGAEAEAEFKRALELDPGDAETHQWYASVLHSMGRQQESLRAIDEARQLKPDSVTIAATRAFFLRGTNPSAARTALEEIVRTQPDFAYAHRYLSEADLDEGDDQGFLTEWARYFALAGEPREEQVVDRAQTAFAKGGEAAMDRTLAEGLGALADAPDSADAMDAATFYARAREPERTLHFLALSCGRRESSFLVTPMVGEFSFLRGNPRFEELVTRSRTPLTDTQVASAGEADRLR